jgi:hypothetical protein
MLTFAPDVCTAHDETANVGWTARLSPLREKADVFHRAHKIGLADLGQWTVGAIELRPQPFERVTRFFYCCSPFPLLDGSAAV